MSRITNNDYVAKTFFVVLQEKCLENLNIEPLWNEPKEFADRLYSTFNEITDGKFYGAICISANGLKHIHLVTTYKSAKRVPTVAKTLGSAHIEIMRGTKDQARDYVEKKGKFEEKGEKVLAFFGDAESIENNQGKRTDLDFDKLAIAEDFNINAYILKNCHNERDSRYYENRYRRLLDLNAEIDREVEVIYVQGNAGQGKTRGAYKIDPNLFKASVSEKTAFPFDNYLGQRTLLLDELRPGVFTHAELMQILDRYPLTVNIKGGHMQARWTRVIIATAMPLSEWYKDETMLDNENKKSQFLRRIKKHYIAVNNEWKEYNEDTDFIQISDADIKNLPFD